jgi:hypothetical protein
MRWGKLEKLEQMLLAGREWHANPRGCCFSPVAPSGLGAVHLKRLFSAVPRAPCCVLRAQCSVFTENKDTVGILGGR